MRPTLKIPIRLDVNTDRLQSETNRLINGLYDYAGQVDALVEVLPEFPSFVVTGTASAAYETILRVSPALSTTTITITLPPPKTQDGGRNLGVARLTSTGIVIVAPTGGATLNGRSRMLLYGSPLLTKFTFDGSNWYSDNPGYVGWDEFA